MTGLNDRLLRAPRWVVGLVSGVPFGAVMGTMTGLRHGRWVEGLVVGVVSAVIYGAVFGVFMHRRFRRYREAIGGVPRREIRKAAREAGKGKVPANAEARRAAYRVLETQVGELRRQRRWAPIVFVLLLANSVFLALVRTPWWWVTVPFWLALLAMHFVLPKRMERRLAVLRD